MAVISPVVSARRVWWAAACFYLCGAGAGFAQSGIDSFGVGKKSDYLQNSSAIPSLHAIVGDPNGPFHFSAELGGTGLDLLSPAPKVTLPNNSTKFTLTGNSSSMGLAGNYGSKAALDTAFPNGTYSFTASTATLPISLGASDSYPAEIPQVSNGTWDAQGRLVVNAATGGVLAFNDFSGYGSGAGGIITFNLYNLTGTTPGSELVAVQSIALAGYSSDPALTSYVVPAGLLQAERTYYAELSFGRIVNLNTTFLPAVGSATFLKTTAFVISTAAPIVAPTITTQPLGQSVAVGATVTLTVAASGNPVPTYQWRKDGAAISGATFSSFNLNNVQAADAGSYTVVASNGAGVATSDAAILTVATTTGAPAITTQPTSQSVTVDGTVTFISAASGTPTPTYQWQKDGVNLGGATSATLALSNVQLANAGSYTMVATNSAGTATSNPAMLTVNAGSVAPLITTQPLSQTVTAGSAITLTGAASGNPAPTFQWQKDGVTIAGATVASLTFNAVQLSDAGTYTLLATNSVSTATSNAAILTVNASAVAPVITTQPQSQSVAAGANVTFTTAASGNPAPSFQWQRNGSDIPGANGADLTITNGQSADSGQYRLIATNSAGVATSNVATLTVGNFPAGFDAAGYLARYPDVAAIFGTDYAGAWLYYRKTGIYQGEVYDELFRVEEYLALYPELFAIFGTDLGAALEHWLNTGRIEGRLGRIPLEFSAAGYFSRNPDVATAVNNDPILAWGHFWAYGIYEGRAYDDEFRVFEYLALNADLQAAFLTDWRGATLHWMRFGRTEGRLGRIPLIFSATEYLRRYPEVGVAWGTYPTTVWLHFWLYGIDEGRTFDELFRVDEYLALNPDLAAIFGTNRRGAFTHWVRYGQSEGRLGRYP